MALSRWLVAFTLIAAGACSDTSGCTTQPLPGGALPADQTLEGGAQIRVTKNGLDKLTSLVPGLLEDQLGDGICVPEGTQATLHYCYEVQGTCNTGCKLDVSVNQTQFMVTNPFTLTVRLDLAASGTVPVEGQDIDPCYLSIAGDHLYGDADVELVPDEATGELAISVPRIRNVDLSRLEITGDTGFCAGAAAFIEFLAQALEQQLVDFITPTLNDLIQGYLPDPLGLAGVIDLGALLAGISPGTTGALEARIVPGGFTALSTTPQGLTLGMITGVNADHDPTSRSPSADSEPAPCVPPLPLPAFGAPPYSLAQTTRETFELPTAPAFSGSLDPAGMDLSVGISETTLDLIGYHAVTSGALCLGIGTSLVSQLNVGTFGLLVPSVAELANPDGNDPVLIVTRPQQRLDFSIGDNTIVSPAITLHVRDLELDVYPFLFERYTRAFTMRATLDVGINLDIAQTPEGTWEITPMLVGLTADKVAIDVLNSQFVAESAMQLEGALPSVFDLLVSQLAIPPVELPTFAGFSLDNPTLQKVTSPSGDFLAIWANFGVTPMLRELATRNRFIAGTVHEISRTIAPPGPRAGGNARLRDVDVPPPDAIRSALAGIGGALPSITFEVDRYDAGGRALEWSWRIGGGLWRPWTEAAPLVIRDRALAWQGAYTLELRSRVAGDPRTVSDVTRVPVVIDSVGPHVVPARSGWEGDRYAVAGWDVVSGETIRIAFGTPGDAQPRTEWYAGARAVLARADAQALADDGELAVFLEDASGNRTIARVAPFHGQASEAGCACSGGAGSPAGTLVAAVTMLLGLRRRRARTAQARPFSPGTTLRT